MPDRILMRGCNCDALGRECSWFESPNAHVREECPRHIANTRVVEGLPCPCSPFSSGLTWHIDGVCHMCGLSIKKECMFHA